MPAEPAAIDSRVLMVSSPFGVPTDIPHLLQISPTSTHSTPLTGNTGYPPAAPSRNETTAAADCVSKVYGKS